MTSQLPASLKGSGTWLIPNSTLIPVWHNRWLILQAQSLRAMGIKGKPQHTNFERRLLQISVISFEFAFASIVNKRWNFPHEKYNWWLLGLHSAPQRWKAVPISEGWQGHWGYEPVCPLSTQRPWCSAVHGWLSLWDRAGRPFPSCHCFCTTHLPGMIFQ